MTFALGVLPVVLLLIGFPIYVVLLTAVSVALLTVYDMVKTADRAMELGAIRLVEKTGGKSGTWRRSATSEP